MSRAVQSAVTHFVWYESDSEKSEPIKCVNLPGYHDCNMLLWYNPCLKAGPGYQYKLQVTN